MTQSEVYEVYRKKGVRLTAEMSPLLYKHFYARKTPIMVQIGYHMFDKAHVVMLTETGCIPKEAGAGILRALRQMDKEGVEKIRAELGGHMHCGEAYATKIAGPDAGGWIHCGRSSGDLGAVAHRIAIRDFELRVMNQLIQIRETFLERAEEHLETIMPGYTHLQHAEPITYGFYLLSWIHQFERDFGRFFDAYRRTNISPAGCAILTTTDFPLDRARTQELLGFDGMYTNAKDGIWSMDHLSEAMGALMTGAGTVARLADDLNIWHSSEFGMVEHPDEFCGTSSIMPQKKNPYGTECVRGLASNVIGQVVGFWASTKAQSDSCEMVVMSPSHVYEAFESYLGALEIIGGVVSGLKLDKDQMRKRAGMFWAQASTLANVITREKNLPFRVSHQIVGVLVRIAYEERKSPEDITPEMVDRAYMEISGRKLNLSQDALRQALDPETVVRNRGLIGGPSPDETAADVVRVRESLAADHKNLNAFQERLIRSQEQLEKAIDLIIA